MPLRQPLPFTFNMIYSAGVAFIVPFVQLLCQSLAFSGARIGLLTWIMLWGVAISSPLRAGLAEFCADWLQSAE